MSTTVPKEQLRAIFATLSGFDASRVIWEGEPLPFAGPTDGGVTGLLRLQTIARRRIGIDESTRVYNLDGTTTITYIGNRVLTLQVRAEKYETSDEGVELLELVRLGLGQGDTRELLNTAGLSLATVDDIRDLGGTADNRATFFAVLDLTLNQQISRSVTSTTDTYIAEVEVMGQSDLSRAGTDDIGPVPPPSS